MATTHNKKEELKQSFKDFLDKETLKLSDSISTSNGDWVVKGFIDVAKNIYTISIDTKVISKVMELLIFPHICSIAENNGYKWERCEEQNFYPDMTFIDKSGNKFAVDIKSSYRKNENSINGMTLGAYTGYFRNRTSSKNVSYPYNDYVGHYVLGIIYSRSADIPVEGKIYRLEDLKSISSVVNNVSFFVQEKYKIASDKPGSGNTKNIGSISDIKELIDGKGPFSSLGEKVFDDYWMFYLTNDMAKAAELAKAPYSNLAQFKSLKNIK
ncbi:MAG: type II restriction endonuclease [Bacteroidales bacterium]